MRTVTYSRQSENWIVRGNERKPGENGELVLTKKDLPGIKAVDLKAALAAHAGNYYRDHNEAEVSELDEDFFDVEYGGGPIRFELRQGKLLVSLIYLDEWPDDDDEVALEHAIRNLIAPLLSTRRSSLHSVEVDHAWSGPELIAVRIRLQVPWRGRTLDQLFTIGEEVLRLCDAFGARDITRESVTHLVRGGHAKLLIGQSEGHWLDAKSQEYDLTDTHGKVSLAQAVARFANAEEGGLIVIGAKTKKTPGGEVIRQVPGVVPRQNDTQARYLGVLDQHLYPPVSGIKIDLVPANDGRALIAIDVPPQSDEHKPFLVHGAILTDEKTEGAFISIVQRRGEGSIPITAPMIHSTIVAGRAVLRGQSLPK